LTEVQDIAGEEGNFSVKLQQNPRYVDMDKCIACGLCAEKCPKKVPNEFNMGLDKRKAAYIQYGQAVPLKYAIDPEHCIYFKKGKCRACEKFCPTGAVDFEQQPEQKEIQVGSVVLSTGFKPYDPSGVDFLGYDQVPDVVTSLEYERLLSASGPCLGHLVRPSDGEEPQKIGWLQCVGSRATNYCDNAYCSSVCCMYAIKQALVTADHTSEELDESIFYMDVRTHGKEFEQYYNQAQDKGIKFERSRIHSLTPGPDNKGVHVRYFTDDGQLKEEHFDMFVLSIGLEAPGDVQAMAEKLGLELDEHKFASCSSFTPVNSSRPGIYVSGALAGPKDIPQSVLDASAAACAASGKLAEARGTMTPEKETPAQKDVRNDPVRIGVFVCSCGINIASVVDVNEVAEHAKNLPGVAYVDNNLFSCSQDTQDKMTEIIKEQNLNRLVVAACTPKTHEPLFQETLEAAGINKYLFTMANIRNQDSWVHANNPELATQKAKELVEMSVAKAARLTPLEEVHLGVKPSALVIGGGIAGMNSALELAKQGYETHLVERDSQLGGNARFLDSTAQGEKIGPYLKDLVSKVENESRISLHLNSSISDVQGFVGNFSTTLNTDQGEKTIEHGATIVATGAQESKPNEYAYGEHPGVMTHQDMDKAMQDGSLDLKEVQNAVFIQCVGSREPERPYCSKVCCTHSIKSALRIKEENPEARVMVLYRDMRTYGERELLYEKARAKGVIFVRFDLDSKPKVEVKDGKPQVTVYDPILDMDLIVDADLVSLASAIEPRDNSGLAQMFKLPLNNEGWFQEAHAKLRPVDFVTDGVFMAGMTHYPKPVEEAIAQAQAAVARAVTVLSRTEMTLPGTVSVIDKSKCVGCGVCWTICPYQAISEDENGLAEVNEALCKGCGLCTAACRSGAPSLGGFTHQEILAQVMAI
jgi:heterodisulfide reductase subunit A